MKHIVVIFFLFIVLVCSTKASTNDSISILEKSKEMVLYCEKIDFSDPNILKLGVYYKASELITYNGHHKADYSNKAEKSYVDSLCKKINVILGLNKDWHFGSFNKKSDSILYQEIKFRNSIYEPYSRVKLVFIKSDNDYFIMGIE